ncbi:hypothetical protein AVEN_257135-1 [Araneus ventricosus]|uniref:Uncharacterized protein n=1 Tax=Araneus ventricosus TaxID=182803 RepID=A0A4Y2FT45_ARAVE|nr:hypothetical protein AVEN_257135-1 [Araneus ventricosus]
MVKTREITEMEAKFEKLLVFMEEMKKRQEDMRANILNVTRTSIKLSICNGKTSCQVYKTQFSYVAEANGWDSITEACHLAASLRAEAANILRTVPEHQNLNFKMISDTLE